MSKLHLSRGVSTLALAFSMFGFANPINAQTEPQPLPPVDVTAPAPLGSAASFPPAYSPASPGTAAIVQRYQLPQTTESISAKQIEETINIVDPEDAVKYLPSLFVRKRNDGDNQAVLATRSWGLSSSARTLIYADDVLLSSLIGNNNSAASPHWNLVSPESIERIDFLEGPFAAAYPGNSMGGVLLIKTKMPDHLTMTMKQTESFQDFNIYGTNGVFRTDQTSATIGGREGIFSWFFTANYLNSYSQPLTYTTNATPPANTVGAFVALNKQGLPADVVGTGAFLHNEQFVTNLKLAVDLTTSLRATYSLGFWSNDQLSTPISYIRSSVSGGPTFGNVAGFASGEYSWLEHHLTNSLSLGSDTKGPFDIDFSVSAYDYLTDIQRNPFSVSPYTVSGGTVTSAGTGFTSIGKIARLDGTNWETIDLKAIYRPFGIEGPQEISFGLHGDRYYLNNPTYQTNNWSGGSNTGTGQLYSDGLGETLTGGAWLQDVWKIAPELKLTVGGRLENWQAKDGFNLTTVTNNTIGSASIGAITALSGVHQPALHSTDFSPKISLQWTPDKDWTVTGSFGEAYRYPTVGELYAISTSGTNFVIPNPYLSPEQDLNGEISVERKWADAKIRLTLYHENTNNALISQTNFVTIGTAQSTVTSVANVSAVRNQGIELSGQKDDVVIRGLQLFASMTYDDSRILSDPAWAGTNPFTGLSDSVVGKRIPYVPEWRTTFGYTYRPDDHWAWTLAARYSGKQYSTLDNTDIVSGVYGAFDNFFVVDTRIHYQANANISFDFGIDNLNNDKYFLFHPFPGRTFMADAKLSF